MRRSIRLGHSPDPDDAFMFFALAEGRLETGGLELQQVVEELETLNRWAVEGRLEVTALSIHAYAYCADRYLLLPHGASMGSGYGPIVVARTPLTLEELRAARIAIPGILTTAFLVLRLLLGEFPYLQVPFDRIFEAVASGECRAGLLIHEGQLTYQRHQFVKLLDLGEEWQRQTGLPLPLGGNAVRRDLPLEVRQQVSRLLKESIQYAFGHREEALRYAMRFARDLDEPTTDRFVGMYVNDLTLELGPEGRRSVELLLGMGHERGIVKRPVAVEFVG